MLGLFVTASQNSPLPDTDTLPLISASADLRYCCCWKPLYVSTILTNLQNRIGPAASEDKSQPQQTKSCCKYEKSLDLKTNKRCGGTFVPRWYITDQ